MTRLLETRLLTAVVAAAVLVGMSRTGRAEPPMAAQLVTHQQLLSSELNLPAGPRLTPAAPHEIPAIDCVNTCPNGCEPTWAAMRSETAFQQWAQGEYVGRSRLPHVPTYRLRVDDTIEFAYRVDRRRLPEGYKLNVGDQFVVQSLADPKLTRTLTVLPDGTITLPLIGSVDAAGLTAGQLRNRLEEDFKPHFEQPGISITPIKVNSQLEDLRYTVGGMSGFGGQEYLGRVSPEGTVQLPAIGSVPAEGLTLEEFKTELDERYAERIAGMEVIPTLREKAPRYCYVLGEVDRPGRYSLEAPTTVMQAITMAGSWNVGAEITHVVVFRRADDWRLIATTLDLRSALLGEQPCPDAEIWLADNDLVIVPKSKLLRSANFIELVFTRGIYGVIPVRFGVNYTAFRGILPIIPIF
jgi:polysaccharide export outer membrane protein